LLPFMEDKESLLPCDLKEEEEAKSVEADVARQDSTSARSFSPTEELVARAASTFWQ